ncbi:MAG: hypothetical protein CM1200mP2_34540 [Planctomycetaceae bacterium]|nr:MAG: hypothetical protein CM1200mP2_34540 [Planctomycetaceae bacterium]
MPQLGSRRRGGRHPLGGRHPCQPPSSEADGISSQKTRTSRTRWGPSRMGSRGDGSWFGPVHRPAVRGLAGRSRASRDVAVPTCPGFNRSLRRRRPVRVAGRRGVCRDSRTSASAARGRCQWRGPPAPLESLARSGFQRFGRHHSRSRGPRAVFTSPRKPCGPCRSRSHFGAVERLHWATSRPFSRRRKMDTVGVWWKTCQFRSCRSRPLPGVVSSTCR